MPPVCWCCARIHAGVVNTLSDESREQVGPCLCVVCLSASVPALLALDRLSCCPPALVRCRHYIVACLQMRKVFLKCSQVPASAKGSPK